MNLDISPNVINKQEVIKLLKNEQLQVNINVIKVEIPELPIMWDMQTLIKQAGFSKSYILEDIKNGILIRDKHYVMKGSHYLFVRDEMISYITNKFKIKK